MEWLILLLGLLTVTTAMVVRSYFPESQAMGEMPAGFNNSVLAFEFIRSQQELSALFNISPLVQRDRIISRVNTGNRADYAFAVLYALLSAILAYFLLGRAGLTDQWRWLTTIAAIILSITAGICDILENRILLSIAGEQKFIVKPHQLNRLTRRVTTKFITLTVALALTLPFWLHIIQVETTALKIWAGLTIGVLVVALVGAFMVALGRRAAAEWLLLLQLISMSSAWAYIIYLLISHP